MVSYRSCDTKEERVSKTSVKTKRYSAAPRSGLVTSPQTTIVRITVRDKSKKLNGIKVSDKLHSVWKEGGREREKKGSKGGKRKRGK